MFSQSDYVTTSSAFAVGDQDGPRTLCDEAPMILLDRAVGIIVVIIELVSAPYLKSQKGSPIALLL